jgi:hypothetical protein
MKSFAYSHFLLSTVVLTIDQISIGGNTQAVKKYTSGCLQLQAISEEPTSRIYSVLELANLISFL